MTIEGSESTFEEPNLDNDANSVIQDEKKTDTPSVRSVSTKVAYFHDKINYWLDLQMPITKMLELARADVDQPYTGKQTAFYDYVRKIRRARVPQAGRIAPTPEDLAKNDLRLDWRKMSDEALSKPQTLISNFENPTIDAPLDPTTQNIPAASNIKVEATLATDSASEPQSSVEKMVNQNASLSYNDLKGEETSSGSTGNKVINNIADHKLANLEEQSVSKLSKTKNARTKRDTKDRLYDAAQLNERFHQLFLQLNLEPSFENPLLMGVASSVRGEGRTTVAMGLATSIAQQTPLRVLLVETDLENPVLANDLNIPNIGLSEYIRGEIELDDLVQPTGQPDLSVIVAGNCMDFPLKTLRSENLNYLVAMLRHQFAAMLFDLPPMSNTGEAARVISQIDQVLMVVEAGVTPEKQVKAALDLIPEEKLVGVILNRTKPAFGLFSQVKRLFKK